MGLRSRVTIFDYATLVVLAVSGLAGMARGATREISTVVALVVAATVAASTLRFTAPLAGHVIHTHWMANTAAILSVFLLTYIVLRLTGGALTRGVRQTSLSGLDRLLGLGIGLVRALVVIGGFVLLIRTVTPPERMPLWISAAGFFPLASASADALKAFGPQGLRVAREVAPTLDAQPEIDATAGYPKSEATPRHRHTGDTTEETP